MRDDLISQNELLEGIDDLIAGIAFTSPYQDELQSLISGMERVRDRVAEAPTLTLDDLRPKGRWEVIEDYVSSLGYTVIDGYRCSLCKEESREALDFCGHCGADMRGDRKDGR